MSQRARLLLTAALVVALASTAACTAGSSAAPGSAGPPGGKPNLVLVLTDDLSTNLLPYLPHVQDLAKTGTSFANYTVTDSLCCPSRSSLFTGMMPHDTGVFTNGGQDGGYGVFHGRGDDKSTYATSLQQAGYRTAMMGKYLNGYQPKTDGVPPGWNEWDVAGNGYGEFNYDLNENGTVKHYGKKPEDYLVDVMAGKAAQFVSGSAAAHTPFAIELATFAPHGPYTPAPRDADAFPGLTAPRGPAFDTLPSAAPSWLASRTPLTDAEKQSIDKDFRKRAQAVQSVDKMIGTVEDALDKAGVRGNTDLVFTSDNGYHMGEYRLTPGKQTAFDTDVHVPLVVSGPGVKSGATVSQPAENVDLRPTFEALAGAATPAEVDGESLVPLLNGTSPPAWRTVGLVEHHGPDFDQADPDKPTKHSGNPSTYEAIRSTTYTYVEYKDGTKEYYDRSTDPQELHNTAAQLPADKAQQLHDTLQAMISCHGATACRH
ncbi:sulfatase [Amycolatopsis sp. PS_44_ISF1]|uniref:sulfatase family protein n=1 Tax=Amycolatopsis sp. PS_44_ISF1 TaxID=2974917 RepID=UPI0028DFBB3A|nr:sulfatase [Amycolatopsis sp. PS_44_ISF1]MDT8914485.1 sulfatase [Amycolatopsis sp. PS_44_ISF1]